MVDYECSIIRLLMINSYLTSHKTKYRITLELDVMQDFNPYEINWRKVFDLQSSEKVKSYIEDLSIDY